MSSRKTDGDLRPSSNVNVNSWEADATKVLSNAELSDLAAAIGTGFMSWGAPEADVDAAIAKLRYGKVIVMADADIDGCFVGDTLVDTVDSLVPFWLLAERERAGLPPLTGYALDRDGNEVEVLLEAPRMTKWTSEYVSVRIEDNELEDVCTPDHQYRMEDGTYRQARDLAAGDRLAGGLVVKRTLASTWDSSEDGCEPVYDLTVREHHNFRLGSGAYVHNSHIECLLLGHIFKHMRPLIERGHVYLALPPLYRITEKGKRTYLKDDRALADFFRRRAKKVTGDDAYLLRLAGCASLVRNAIERAARSAGAAPDDVSHALGLDVNDPTAMAEAIVEKREADGCEGVEGFTLEDGQAVVSGLAPGGRFFTTVVGEPFMAAVTEARTAVLELLGSLPAGRIEVAGRSCYHLLELAEVIETESQRGISIMRIKGLGEMQSEELGSTTLDVATRRLVRVTVGDFDAAGEFIGSMMSSGSVEARRELIQAAQVAEEMIDA